MKRRKTLTILGSTAPTTVGAIAAHYHDDCWMGSDQQDSVVRSLSKKHDVPNLSYHGWQCVGSAAVNPTPTIVALKIQTTDDLIEQLIFI